MIPEEKEAKALLDRETLGEMLTTEFMVKGFTPSNVRLEIINMETDGDFLELSLKVHEEYLH